MKILYSEPVDLKTISLDILDQLYYLAEKYLVFEMQESILEAVKDAKKSLWSVQDIELLLSVKSKGPVKVAFTDVVIQFLTDGYGSAFASGSPVDDISFLATAYYSGLYSDIVKEAMLIGLEACINDSDYEIHVLQLFADVPQSEDNSKFIHMFIQRFFSTN